MLRDSGPLAPSTYYNISMTFVKDKSKYCSFYEMAKRRSPALKSVRNPGSRDGQTSAPRDSEVREEVGLGWDSAGLRIVSVFSAGSPPLHP